MLEVERELLEEARKKNGKDYLRIVSSKARASNNLLRLPNLQLLLREIWDFFGTTIGTK